MTDTQDRRKSRSLFGRVGDVPRLVKQLVQGEISLLKEMQDPNIDKKNRARGPWTCS